MVLSSLHKQLLHNRFVLILIGLITIVIYSNIFNNPFTFDDRSSIVENSTIKNLPGFLIKGKLLEPRAIVDLTFALNYRIGGLNVFGYHLVNILIHILNGFIAYFLVRAVLKQQPELFHLSNNSILSHPIIQFGQFHYFQPLFLLRIRSRPRLSPTLRSDMHLWQLCFIWVPCFFLYTQE